MTFLVRHFPWISTCIRFFQQSLTTGGKTLVCATVFAFINLTSFDLRFSPLFWMLGTILLASAVISWTAYPKLNCRMSLPHSARCGEEFDLPVILTNVGRFTGFDLAVAVENAHGSWIVDDPKHVVTIPVDSHSVLTLKVRPNRRGVYTWPQIRVVSTFPFNLIHRSQFFSERGEVFVIPRSLEIQSNLTGESEWNGEFSRETCGSSLEFMGNREYRPGVPVIRWNHRAWARLGQPVVQEFWGTRNQRVGIILDSFKDSTNPEIDNEFESAVALATSLIDELLNAETSIDWLIGGDVVANLVDMNPLDRIETVREILARVQMQREPRLDEAIKITTANENPPDVVIVVFRSNQQRWNAISAIINDIAATIRPVEVCNMPIEDTKARQPKDVVSVAAIEYGAVSLS